MGVKSHHDQDMEKGPEDVRAEHLLPLRWKQMEFVYLGRGGGSLMMKTLPVYMEDFESWCGIYVLYGRTTGHVFVYLEPTELWLFQPDAPFIILLNTRTFNVEPEFWYSVFSHCLWC